MLWNYTHISRCDEALRPFAHWPEYFAKYGPTEPITKDHNPYSFAHFRPESNIFDIMAGEPERMKAFMISMDLQEKHLPLTGMYDFSWVSKVAKEEPNRVLLVDVGGGQGQALKAISKENPELPRERFVLEDRPDVIEAVKTLDEEDLRGAQVVGVDFHMEQPVKGKIIDNTQILVNI